MYCVYHTYGLFTFAPAADTLISTDTKYSEVIMKQGEAPNNHVHKRNATPKAVLTKRFLYARPQAAALCLKA